MYEQTLYTILEDYITPSTLKKNNKYKKWEYGEDIPDEDSLSIEVMFNDNNIMVYKW